MAEIKDIKLAMQTLIQSGCKNIALLKCTSNYPANPKFSNLVTLKNMRKKFKCEVGLSDHTKGIGVAIASIALGSSIIEKHLTLDKNNGAVDSKFSLEPKDFYNLRIEIDNSWKSIGVNKYGPSQDDIINLKFRRSIYYIKDLKKHHKLKKNDIKIVRPSYGLEPKYFKKILGKVLKNHIKSNTPVSLKDFK